MTKAELITKAINSAMLEIEECFNQTITYNNSEYPCRISAVTEEMRLVNAYQPSVSRIVLLRKELFTLTFPQPKELVICGGKAYLIESIEETEEAIKLVLANVNKRA